MSGLIANLQRLGDGEIDDLGIAHDALSEIVGLRLRIAELEAALAEAQASDAESLALYRNCRDRCDAMQAALAEAQRDAARYALLRRGQQWSIINGIGDALRADDLDAAIDAAM